MRKMWHSAQKLGRNMAEFNTVHIVSLENASRFFSGAPVKICHIPVNFFMTIAKIFHNPSKVSYVDLSSKRVGNPRYEPDLNCNSNWPLLNKMESDNIWKNLTRLM